MCKISICIPTYKRVKYLMQNLDSIATSNRASDIEIVICDNDSNEDNYVESRLKKYKNLNIIYKKNYENLGIDRNMIHTIEIASGSYCLWLGDDDILEKDTIESLLDTVKNNDYDFILASTTWISEDLTQKGEKWSTLIDREYFNLSEFLNDHIFNMPFGSIVVKKKYLYHTDILKYFGTSHAYSGYIIEYLNLIQQERNIRVLVSSNIKVYLRECKKSWSENSFKIHYEDIPKWFCLLPDDISCKKELLKVYLKKIFTQNNIFFNVVTIRRLNELNLSYEISCTNKCKIRLLGIIRFVYKVKRKQIEN